MNAYFRKETNIEVGEIFYGYIADSIYTNGGVYLIKVEDIDWENEQVIFQINQPCGRVAVFFDDFNTYVFKNGEDALNMDFSKDEGLHCV